MWLHPSVYYLKSVFYYCNMSCYWVLVPGSEHHSEMYEPLEIELESRSSWNSKTAYRTCFWYVLTGVRKLRWEISDPSSLTTTMSLGLDESLKEGRGAMPDSKNPLAGTKPFGLFFMHMVPLLTMSACYWQGINVWREPSVRKRSLTTSDASLALANNIWTRRNPTYPVMMIRTLDSDGAKECRSMTAVVYDTCVSTAGIRQRNLIQAWLSSEILAVPKMDWLATLWLPECDTRIQYTLQTVYLRLDAE